MQNVDFKNSHLVSVLLSGSLGEKWIIVILINSDVLKVILISWWSTCAVSDSNLNHQGRKHSGCVEEHYVYTGDVILLL